MIMKQSKEKFDFKAFGQAIKAARKAKGISRNQLADKLNIAPRYIASIENSGQHPSLQIFFELMLRYHISVDQFLLDTQPEKDTKRRQLDALLDDMSDTGIRIVTATAKEIAEVENEN
jgi:transcriptional regulator with XRE-family HTH domain